MASEEGKHNWDFGKMDDDKFIRTLSVLRDWNEDAMKEAKRRGLIVDGIWVHDQITVLKKLT